MNGAVLSHRICGRLSQQPWETPAGGHCGQERGSLGSTFLRRGCLSPNLKKVMSEPDKDDQEGLSRQRERPLRRPVGGPGYRGWAVTLGCPVQRWVRSDQLEPQRSQQPSARFSNRTVPCFGGPHGVGSGEEGMCLGRPEGLRGAGGRGPRHWPHRSKSDLYLVSFRPTPCFSF